MKLNAEKNAEGHTKTGSEYFMKYSEPTLKLPKFGFETYLSGLIYSHFINIKGINHLIPLQKIWLNADLF